jgi:hypothetical protein
MWSVGLSRPHSQPPPYESIDQRVVPWPSTPATDEKLQPPNPSLSADDEAERQAWAERVLVAERREIANYGTLSERRRIEREDRRNRDPAYHRQRLWERNFGGEDVDVELQRAIETSTNDLEAQTMVRERDEHPVSVPLGTRPDGRPWVAENSIERAELDQIKRAIKESLADMRHQ